METAYRQIWREFVGQIEAGELKPGDRLPTEHELCERFGVSRTTVGKAMSALVSDGYISRKPGVGSTVVTRKSQVNLTSFINPDSATAGHPGAHEVIHSAVVSATEAGIDVPGLRSDEPVIVLLRRKLDVAGSPISIERHALPFAVAPKLLEEDLETLVSMRYLRKLGVSIASIRLYLIPYTLTQEDAELLDASSGEATLIRRRELLDQEGRMQETVETIVRPGSADFYLEVPGPDA